jgi:GTP pyrophosphokinase
MAGDLEDLAFPYVYPKEHKWLMNSIGERYEERKRYLEPLVPIIEQALKNAGITALSIHARAKHYYSLYKKLLRKDMNLEAIHDLVALRVVVSSIEECYGALGAVHAMWKPMPGRIKDYIALPKPNGYRSIHTSVFGPQGKIIEIQIRTMEMHEESERGITAHWHYAEGKTGALRSESIPKEFTWVWQLQQWQKEHSIEDDFIESLKIDFFKDRIFVITPKGKVIDLPDGSTPVDFAYQIHTDIGNQCAGAKVNGQIVPLDFKLTSGEVIEILTQKNKMPSEQWLEFVKTSFAKQKIRDALRKKQGAVRALGRPGAGLALGRPGAGLAPQKPAEQETDFRISAKDRIGLIKDISRVFAKSKISILEFNTDARAAYPTMVITCALSDPKKSAKIAMKLRSVQNVETVSFKPKNRR